MTKREEAYFAVVRSLLFNARLYAESVDVSFQRAQEEQSVEIEDEAKSINNVNRSFLPMLKTFADVLDALQTQVDDQVLDMIIQQYGQTWRQDLNEFLEKYPTAKAAKDIAADVYEEDQ